MQSPKTILVAPLNWGLGHASRCIPIIHQLLQMDCKVVLAADGQALQLLRSEFPELPFEILSGIKTTYSKFIPIPILLLLRAPKLFNSIKKEQEATKKLVDKYKVDGVISDNRYGCYHQAVSSIIITHQLAIKSPFLKKHAQKLVEKLISKFDVCWVPDFAGKENLSGDLSHLPTKLNNIEFIGPLSRFKKRNVPENFTRKLLVLLSGPEPNRTVFEKKMMHQLQQFNHETLVVRGKLNHKTPKSKNAKVEFAAHLPTAELQKEIEASELVLCRSGYSSLMDLSRIGKKVLLVPTPGQSEQEYLAKRLSKMKRCFSVKQSAMDIPNDIEKALAYEPLQLAGQSDLLKIKLNQWLIEVNR